MDTNKCLKRDMKQMKHDQVEISIVQSAYKYLCSQPQASVKLFTLYKYTDFRLRNVSKENFRSILKNHTDMFVVLKDGSSELVTINGTNEPKLVPIRSAKEDLRATQSCNVKEKDMENRKTKAQVKKKKKVKDTRTKVNSKPCKYFAVNSCKYGSACQYSHIKVETHTAETMDKSILSSKMCVVGHSMRESERNSRVNFARSFIKAEGLQEKEHKTQEVNLDKNSEISYGSQLLKCNITNCLDIAEGPLNGKKDSIDEHIARMVCPEDPSKREEKGDINFMAESVTPKVIRKESGIRVIKEKEEEIVYTLLTLLPLPSSSRVNFSKIHKKLLCHVKLPYLNLSVLRQIVLSRPDLIKISVVNKIEYIIRNDKSEIIYKNLQAENILTLSNELQDQERTEAISKPIQERSKMPNPRESIFILKIVCIINSMKEVDANKVIAQILDKINKDILSSKDRCGSMLTKSLLLQILESNTDIFNFGSELRLKKIGIDLVIRCFKWANNISEINLTSDQPPNINFVTVNVSNCRLLVKRMAGLILKSNKKVKLCFQLKNEAFIKHLKPKQISRFGINKVPKHTFRVLVDLAVRLVKLKVVAIDFVNIRFDSIEETCRNLTKTNTKKNELIDAKLEIKEIFSFGDSHPLDQTSDYGSENSLDLDVEPLFSNPTNPIVTIQNELDEPVTTQSDLEEPETKAGADGTAVVQDKEIVKPCCSIL